MAQQKIKLLEKKQIANGTMEFVWEKPAGFEFRAGQFGDFTLIDPPETDTEGNVRTFSIVTAPFENTLSIATRMRDTAFKRVLGNLSVGTEVSMDAPYGDFKLHNNAEKPAVFVIGGIGVTPVRSIIAEATHQKLPHKITLLHSNKTPEDAPFQDDFVALAKENPNFTFVPVLGSGEVAGVANERGLITAEIVKKYVSDIAAPIYYLAGPEGMVKAMRTLLTGLGVDEDNIRTEEFSGY